MALLSGGVQIDSELVSGASPWVTRMTGDEMQISLDQPVRLMDRASMATAQLAGISLLQTANQPVVVRAEQHDVDHATQSIHVITSKRIDFSPANGGELVGAGPGWYRGWMLTDEKKSVFAGEAVATRHIPRKVLQGVHLTFRESMQGDLQHETLAFTGGVRTGIRKLQSWDEAVDVRQMERLAAGEMTMDCQQLQFGITQGMPDDLRSIPGMPTPWEMVAEGGVLVRSNTEERGLIEGTANRASFESKKSWLVVEAAPGQNALLRQTKPDGTIGANVSYPRMAVNLKTYAFEMLMQEAKLSDLPVPNTR
jgi:hypothetical protein